MSIVAEYYIDAFLQKADRTGHKLDEIWSRSDFRNIVETWQNFQYKRGEWVEDVEEDQVYEIVERLPAYSAIRNEEVYQVDRLSENPDGELGKSYDKTKITGEEIE